MDTQEPQPSTATARRPPPSPVGAGANPDAEDADGSPARRTRRRIAAFASVLTALAACLIWRLHPIESLPSIAHLLMLAQQARTSPLAPLVALICFVIGGLVVFPVNLLIAATIVMFGPLFGALWALVGSLVSAIAVHEVGRRIPQSTVERLFGERGERLRARAVGHGVLAVAIVRLLPVAPYSVVSLISGVARIRRRDYLLGTALGMLPGVVMYALFIDRARAVLLDPHPLAWAGLAAALVLILGTALAVRLWQRKRDAACERSLP